MRGKGDTEQSAHLPHGITPAYAGKSGNDRICKKSLMGSPPAYAGKSIIHHSGAFVNRGSPPPMRGKGRGNALLCPDDRITPAYAGKSTWKCMPFATLQDHPRLCGEKSCTSSRVRNGTGSPPPMRGKAFLSFQ